MVTKAQNTHSNNDKITRQSRSLDFTTKHI